VTNLTSDWRSGLVLGELISALKPDALPFKNARPADPLALAKLCISKAGWSMCAVDLNRPATMINTSMLFDT
jgi:hypothetical protein